MKKYIVFALLMLSVSSFASIQERTEFRNELESALQSLELDSDEAAPVKSSWYLNRMWIEFTPYVTFKIPGLAGLKITPNIRLYLKRGIKAGYQDYKPTAM